METPVSTFKPLGAASYSKYLEVAIPLPIHQTFTYELPLSLAELAQEGKRVLVPFGNRRLTGYIIGKENDPPPSPLKPIIEVLDQKPLFPASMIPFFRWVAVYYHSNLGEVIKCALPTGLNMKDVAKVHISDSGQQALLNSALDPTNRQILSLLEGGPIRLASLKKIIGPSVSSFSFQSIQKKGWISIRRDLTAQQTRTKTERYVRLQKLERLSADALNKWSPIKRKIILALSDNKELAVKKLKEISPSIYHHLKWLQAEGFVEVFPKKVYRNPFGEAVDQDRRLDLTSDQAQVFSTLERDLGRQFVSYLLAGVTGSGKTEIYLQLAAKAVAQGQPTLVLVPEIALISQMESRFRARFGEQVAVLHSGLSAGERYDQWQRILNQETPIAIGARSAIFAPFQRTGLIIVDEEHDPSYKQESSPRYHARDVAVMRAKMDQGMVLLGSATPSLEAYYNVRVTHKYNELSLNKRVQQRPLPEIKIVDLNHHKKEKGFRRFFSPILRSAIQKNLDSGEQTLLFLNRRGFANFPVCQSCGDILECQNCAISMTYHQKEKALRCHYCGFTIPATRPCGSCGSGRISLLGFGTEKVETALQSFFPHARVARLDRDTTSRKGALVKILKAVKNHSVDILVGTQMVAKGHDFPNITLVGIICADLSLHFPDFRSGERTFQLLAQVAGRAGRGNIPGRVILQTYNASHYSIQAARDQNFKLFYEKEIQSRSALKYPPFARMIQLKMSSRMQAEGEKFVQRMGAACRALCADNRLYLNRVDVLGPVTAPLAKIGQRYRWQIILKAEQLKVLHLFVGQLEEMHPTFFRSRQIKVDIDVDPYLMM